MAEALLRKIRQLIREHSNEYVQQFKASGQPVVGYFCHYIPVEVIWAAGALPLRLRGAGSEDSSRADAFMSERLCTYVRHVMALVLDGQYDFLDGSVSSNTCDHVRRAADLFKKKTNLAYHGFVSVPRNLRESLLEYYRNELRKLYHELASQFGNEPSDERLSEAIATYNEVRKRLQRINRLRMQEPARLSGADALAIHIASQVMPPSDFVELADELLAALPQREPLAPSRARVVLVGAELDEPAFVEAIESQGALVVADRLCFGARSVLDCYEPESDPIDAIARAYFFRPSCARMIGDFPQRWAALRHLIAESRSDGVIFERLVFCDPWGGELHNLMHRAKEGEALPLLNLAREYGIVATGQVRTRVQAFVERIEIAAQRGAAQ